jgi:phosphatidylinositol alpha-1,6-mannosyltransferase
VDDVVTQHRSNVVAFYQSNDAIELAALRRHWGRSRGVVLTVFGEVYDDPAFLLSRRGPLGDLLSSADALLASSKHCARSFAKLGLPHEIEAVYYGVDLNRFTGVSAPESKRRYGFSETDVLALFMGRFSEDMGIGAVLEAAPILLERHAALGFLLAGAKGPLADSAARLAAAYPSRIRVVHDVPFAEQPFLYAASDIVLTPTRDQHACMGMTIKEGMAAGRAVVGSDAGGIPEAIREGETGHLVPLDSGGAISKDAFVDAVGRLVSNEAQRTAMGRAGRARAEEIFSHERTIDRVHEVLRSVAR